MSPHHAFLNRRVRLLKFIGLFYPSYEQTRQVFDGYGRSGITIRPTDLIDDALERLAERLRSDFWFTKRLNRQNRAIFAKRKAA